MTFQEIIFTNDEYDAIICIDGDMPSREFFKNFPGIKIIAADGAAHKLLEIDIIPDLVIGDLDSINEDIIYKKFNTDTLIKYEDQDSNDFEKVLRYCRERNIDNNLIVGFHGGELEHTLNNWSVFSRYSKYMSLVIYDYDRYGFIINNSSKIKLKNDEIISLIPQPLCKLTTKGFVWDLNRGKIELGKKEGARNRTKQEEIFLEIYSGELLFFCDARIPQMVRKC